jgi:DNA polymerase-1
MLGRLLGDHSPAGMAVAFDRKEATFRDAIASDYKAGRVEVPSDLHEQVALIRRVVELMGVPVVELSGYEADDVIATLATWLDESGEEVIVVTGDRDTYQLVHDPRVRVLYNRRGVTDYVLYDEAGIRERTGVSPEQYPFFAALRGDPSDNLPGVPGVGEKTAAKLVNTYGTLDELFAHLKDLPPKVSSSLAENEQRVRTNFQLTPLVRDAPLECDLTDLRFGRSDREELDQLFTLLEIKAPRDRIMSALDRLESGADAAVPEPDVAEPAAPVSLVELSDRLAAEDLLARLASTDGGLSLEGEWAAAAGRSRLLGLALALVGEQVGYWLPAELIEELSPALGALLEEREDGLRRIIACRAKELMRTLMPMGISLSGLDVDISVASYLIDPSGNVPNLGGVVIDSPVGAAGGGEQLGFDVESSEAPPGAAAAARAVAVARTVEELRRALAETGAEMLYSSIERPLISVLARMEVTGIAVEESRLRQINAELTAESSRLEAEVHRLAGEPFNVSSTKQLRHVLFDVLKLTPQRRTKTGYSTAAQSLERLRGSHPIIDAILAYREVEKLRSTYGAGLLQEVGPDGRIHASFNQTVARTGRLSSDQPNLHNIPVRSSLGRQFREAFVPADGAELLVADYDQIELRVIAHLSGDPGLVEAFRTGTDIHSATAQRVFGVAADAVTPAMRARAKMVSYGLAYGMEAYGLSQRLAISVEEAADILSQYFAAFPKVKEYMARTVAEARVRGYTETAFGRRRYLPDLDSPNFQVRQAAERQAMNAGIQGLAADIFKVALVRLDAALAKGGCRSRLVLQVHDEILVETFIEEAEVVSALTEDVMKNAAELSVPLAVHVARGNSWAAAKESGPAREGEADDDSALLAELEASGA